MDLSMGVFMPGKYSKKKLDKVWKKVFGWYEAFSRSDHFGRLAEVEQDESEAIVMHFADFMYSCNGLTPKKWNVLGMVGCCIEILPREIAAGPEYFGSVSPVLSAFFRFLEETGILLLAGLLACRVGHLGSIVVENAANPAIWGPAKSFVEAAKAAGLDMNNREGINLFMLHYNQRVDKGELPGSVIAFGSGGPTVVGQMRQSIKGKHTVGKGGRQKDRQQNTKTGGLQ